MRIHCIRGEPRTKPSEENTRRQIASERDAIPEAGISRVVLQERGCDLERDALSSRVWSAPEPGPRGTRARSPPAARSHALLLFRTPSSLGKSSQRKKIDAMTRSAVEGQVGGNFSDHWRKLKTVTGKATAQNQITILRMTIDHKMAVGC